MLDAAMISSSDAKPDREFLLLNRLKGKSQKMNTAIRTRISNSPRRYSAAEELGREK